MVSVFIPTFIISRSGITYLGIASDYTSVEPPRAWAIGGVYVLYSWGVLQIRLIVR